MDRPTAAQLAYAAHAEVSGAASTRLRLANNRIADLRGRYKPKTLTGWTAFIGACMLLLPALSLALTVLSGFLLSLAWVGVVVSTVLVAVSSVGGFVAGGAALFFSGTCAVIGTTILSCACTAYVCQALLKRLRTAANTYLGTTRSTGVPATTYSQPPQQQLQVKEAPHAALLQPAKSSTSSTGTPAAMQLPPMSTPQLSKVAPTVSNIAAVTEVTQDRGHNGASAAWPVTGPVADGGCLSPGRKCAGLAAAGGEALRQAAGVPAFDAQLLPAIGVA